MIAGDKKPECEYVYSAEEHRRLTRIADHYPKVVEALEECVDYYNHDGKYDDLIIEARRLEEEKSDDSR